MSITNANRIVIKVGTSTLTYPNGKPNLRRIEQIARTLSDLRNSGKEVILVTSGAVAVGMQGLGMKKKPTDTPSRQAAAAVGQSDLMMLYDRLFSEYGTKVAQILLTLDVIEHERLKTNVINTFSALLDFGAIPIINENDTVSTEELELKGKLSFGDNDKLSAVVAKLIGADLLIILSDTDALYDEDPHTNPNANRIAVVEAVTDELFQIAGGAGSSRGTGGMRTKLEAIRFATTAGIDTFIVSGENPAIIYDVLEGKSVGTRFKGN